MSRPKRVFVVASVVALFGVAIGAACTFPEVEFAPKGTSGEAGEGGGSEASTDAGADAIDEVAIVEASQPDGEVVKDAGMKVDAQGCTVCDCDGDQFNDTTKAGCSDAGGANDCDDTDTRYKPSQGYLDIPGEPPRNGDWNCSGKVEKAYTAGIKCTSLAANACDGVEGFEDDPPCGASGGKYVQCKTTGTPPLFLDNHCVIGGMNFKTVQLCK